MRKILVVIALLLAGCATGPSQERTYSVYERPGKHDKGTLPIYRAREMPNGEIRLYPYYDKFQYEYRITPDGSIYRYDDPFQRVGNIKNGVSMHTEKGGK